MEDLAIKQAEHAQREQESEALQLTEEEIECKRKEAKKKKPRINDFDGSASVLNIIITCPSQYALQKLNSFDFIELIYDNTFGISKINEVFTLKSVVAIKASHNWIKDHELTFKAFLQAKNNFLYYAKTALWLPKHLNTLANFFWNVETHPMHPNPNSNATILAYASRVFHSWHDGLKTNKAFNISIINGDWMKNISWEIIVRVGEGRTHKACLCSMPMHLTTH
ncbi:hypothetical protein PAXRUDRAFT_17153 [Paxillus rubicundulus Ve08.2h10]|uniref:Uncharacterized protein n=1 Tax=Paxillus rubicundulus Ve08.2h10 TaxID=930991 RepID=A0A0D0DBI1_9AGAM|nr:hypothetical protein PAXRUDRAFT_17153 [Paxillus rubicundulus Ve08.2h10]